MNGLNDSQPTVTKDSVTFESSDRGFVYAVARRIVGSPDDAEDVTQEALLLAYRHRDAFRGSARYRTWLYRIAATTALGHLRRQRRSRIELGLDRNEALLQRPADPETSPEAQIIDAEDRAMVQTALAKLEPSYRDVLLARSVASETDVATQLGISVANVKIRAHRARKKLRDTIDRMASTAA